jgi:hypothetical protein
MGQVMGWRNKVYIVTTLPLQRKHFFGKRFSRNYFSETFLTDLIVLAETAFEVAVGKENGS